MEEESQAPQTEDKEEGKEKKEGFFCKLKRKSKEAVDKGSQYFNGLQEKYDTTKDFNTHSEELLDLSDGSIINAIEVGGQRFLVLQSQDIDDEHRYYCKGKVYSLSRAEENIEVPYTLADKSQSVKCYHVPYELVIDPVGDDKTALDVLRRSIEDYQPNLLGTDKTAKETALRDFDGFIQAVKKHDVQTADAFILNVSDFSVSNASLAARIFCK